MIKVGIAGGAGYTAGELLRLLVNHPGVEIVFVNSQSNAGNKITSVHSGLDGECELSFTSALPLNETDCLFMCSGHGASAEFWKEHERPAALKVIDLAQDFRDESNGYVYGLPEINRTRIAETSLLANPGCFATAIQLALLPLAASSLLPERVNVTGITGSTGAGVKPGATTHFSWRSGNISVYKAFTHQHLIEISRNLSIISGQMAPAIDFIPVRGDFPRGIFIMAVLQTSAPQEEINRIYHEFYSDEPFTHISDEPIHLKSVVNTNKALIHLQKHDDSLLITVAIDNLLKGASGQAVQNMNIMFGLPEDTGLHLKSLAF